MFNRRGENKENFIFRWFQSHFAALPARIEGREIRLRHARMWGKSKSVRCPIVYRIDKKDGGVIRPIGSIGLYNLGLRKSAEIAIEIYEEERGKGYATMALSLFLEDFFFFGKRTVAEELVARVRPENEAAMRLFKRFSTDERFASSREAPGPDGLRKFRLAAGGRETDSNDWREV